MKKLIVLSAAVLTGLVLSAKEFYFTGTSSKWLSFGDPASWYTSWEKIQDGGDAGVKNGTNVDNEIPGPDDTLHCLHGYDTSRYVDLDNASYTVKGFSKSDYKEQWGFRRWWLRNGELKVTDTVSLLRLVLTLQTNAKFIHDETAKTTFGNSGATATLQVNATSEADLRGEITMNPFQLTVDAGGKLTFDPSQTTLGPQNYTTFTKVKVDDVETGEVKTNVLWSGFTNSGTMDFPHGIAFVGHKDRAVGPTDWGAVRFVQRAGTMTFGGSVTADSKAKSYYSFKIEGGKVVATDDATLSAFNEIGITAENGAATVEVAADKTFDWPAATNANGAVLTKIGDGKLRLGGTCHGTIEVTAGALALRDGGRFETIVLPAENALLELDGDCSAETIEGLDTAEVVPGELAAYDTAIFTSSNPQMLAAVLARLNACAADRGSYEIVRNSIVFSATTTREAKTFYWKNNGNTTYHDWSDPANWYTAWTSKPGTGDRSNWKDLDTGSNELEEIPGAQDFLHWTYGYHMYCAFDLGGKHRYIAGYASDYSNIEYGFREYYIKNGTLEFTTNYKPFRNLVYIQPNAGLILGPECAIDLTSNHASETVHDVMNGSRLEVYGPTVIGVSRMNVKAGGTLIFDPASLKLGTGSVEGQGASWFGNFGTTIFPNGLPFEAASGHTKGAVLFLSQSAGTMTFGGPVTKTSAAHAHYQFNLMGGTLDIQDDVSFDFFEQVGMPTNDTSATINVAAGKTLNWANAVFTTNTVLTKTGPGQIILGASLPETFNFTEGILGLVADTTYRALALPAGAGLHATGTGISLTSVEGLADATFTIDTEVIAAGDPTPVITSEDGDLLDLLLARLTGLPETVELVRRENGLYLIPSADAPNVFSASGVLNLADPSGWGAGVAPAEGADVIVTGPDTTAILASTNVVYNSITVTDGATLRIDDTIKTFPTAMKLDYTARLLLEKGTFAAPVSMIQARADAAHLPVIEVGSGATYELNNGAAFKNVHLKVYGRIRAQNPGSNYYFGTADANETAYFALTAENANFDFINNNTTIYWVSPKTATGRVVVPTKLSFKDTTIQSTWNTTFGYSVGYLNPKDEIIVMELDNTLFDMRMGSEGYLTGGLKVLCKNGGALAKPYTWTSPGTYGHPYLQQNFQATFDGPGSTFHYAWNRNPVEIRPDDNGYEQMTFKNGAHLHIMNFRGNDKAVYVFEDGYWDLTERPGFDANYWPVQNPPVAEEDTWTALVSPFTGLKSVRIGDGKFLGLRAFSQNPGTYNEREWNRVMKLANVPVTGENGSMFVTNTLANYTCEAILVCGANTATGELTAYPSGAGCRLTLADGANWAGTLVANECIGFTNLTTAASPATVAVNNVRLAGNFPIRAWKNAGVSDQLVISGSLSRVKGGFTPVAMDGAFVEGDTVVVGTCPAASLPADYEKTLSSGHWVLSAEPIPDTENVTLKVTYRKTGFYMILL